jgi:hypothetical protein
MQNFFEKRKEVIDKELSFSQMRLPFAHIIRELDASINSP